MTDASRGNRDDSSATIKLQDDHRNVIVDLIVCLHQALGEANGTDDPDATKIDAIKQTFRQWLSESAERVSTLQDGVRRALGDSDYLAVWIQCVRDLRKELLLPFCPVADVLLAQVLSDGVEAMDTGDLAYLALSPDQLDVIQDEIAEWLPNYWVEAVEDAMSQSARERGVRRRSTEELLEEVRDRLEPQSAQPANLLDMSMGEELAESRPVQNVKVTMNVLEATGKWEQLAKSSQVSAIVTDHDEQLAITFLSLPIPMSKLTWTCDGEPTESDAIQVIVQPNNREHFVLAAVSSDPDHHVHIQIEITLAE